MHKQEIMTLENQDKKQQGVTNSPNKALILNLTYLSVGSIRDKGNSPFRPG